MNLTPWRKPAETEERSDKTLAFNDYVSLLSSFNFSGHNYTLPGSQQELIGGSYQSLARLGYKTNGIVFACMNIRMRLFSGLFGSKEKSTILHVDIDPDEAVRRIHARGEEVQVHENQRDLTMLRAEFERGIAAARSRASTSLTTPTGRPAIRAPSCVVAARPAWRAPLSLAT